MHGVMSDFKHVVAAVKCFKVGGYGGVLKRGGSHDPQRRFGDIARI